MTRPIIVFGAYGRAIRSRLADDGRAITGSRLAGWLDELDEAGLLFRDGDRYLALATTDVPLRIRT